MSNHPSALQEHVADIRDHNDVRGAVWKERLLEVSIFLFLIIPSMILSFFVTRQGKVDFVFVAASTILRDLALVSLILFLVWRNGEPLGALGWKFRHPTRDVLLGVVLYGPMFSLIALLDSFLLSNMGFSQPQTPGPSFFQFRGQMEVVLAVFLVVVVAVSEETMFRGYLFLRLRTVTRSTTAAVLLTSVIFALGHGYEGSLGVVTVGVMGLVFNLVYLWTKSLVTPVVLHFIQDFLGIVLAHYYVRAIAN